MVEQAGAADADRFRHIAAVSAILSVPLAYLTMGLFMLAVDFDMEIFSEPARLVAIGAEGARLFRWSQLVDMFGFYLLWIPPMVLLWYWLRRHAPLTVTLLAVLGVGFTLIAALGAAINASALASLMVEYAEAGAEQRAAIETVFVTFSNAVIVGFYGIFARLLVSVWLLGTGYYLRRERRALGYGAMIFGVFTSLSFLGNVFGLPEVHSIGVTFYVFVGPLWMLWLGLDLWRRPIDLSTHWSGETPSAPGGAG